MHFVLRWLLAALLVFAAVFTTTRATAQVRATSESACGQPRTGIGTATPVKKQASMKKSPAQRSHARVKPMLPLTAADSADDAIEEGSAEDIGVDEGCDAYLFASGCEAVAPPLHPRDLARRIEPTPSLPPRFIEVPPPRSR